MTVTQTITGQPYPEEIALSFSINRHSFIETDVEEVTRMSSSLISGIRSTGIAIFGSIGKTGKKLGQTRLFSIFVAPFIVKDLGKAATCIVKTKNLSQRTEKGFQCVGLSGELIDAIATASYGISLIQGAKSAAPWMSSLFIVSAVLQLALIARQAYISTRVRVFQKKILSFEETGKREDLKNSLGFLLGSENVHFKEYYLIRDERTISSMAYMALEMIEKGEKIGSDALIEEGERRAKLLLNELKMRSRCQLVVAAVKVTLSFIAILGALALIATPIGAAGWALVGITTGLSLIFSIVVTRMEKKKLQVGEVPAPFIPENAGERFSVPQWQKDYIIAEEKKRYQQQWERLTKKKAAYLPIDLERSLSECGQLQS